VNLRHFIKNTTKMINMASDIVD